MRKIATIAHISDIHFGRIAHPGIVNGLIEEINGSGVDLVAVSGDLTQRAKVRQFEEAAAMLRAFSPPTLVVPGNHDVYAWWHRPLLRLFRPLRRYRQYISSDLMPVFERDGVAVLGINTAHGRTIKGGRIGTEARQKIATFFASREEGTFKVLVLHHHLTQIQALTPHDVARKARKTLEVASRVGVDLILCGHLHVSHVEPVELVPDGHRLVIASAGTATSSRGRGAYKTNYYNVIRIFSDRFLIEERRYDPDLGRFVADRHTEFERV